MRKHGLIVPDTRMTRSHGMHDRGIEPGIGDVRQRRHADACATSPRAAIGCRVLALARHGTGWCVRVSRHDRHARCPFMASGVHRRAHRAGRKAIGRLLMQ